MNILLHICCAPCACYPVEYLRENGFTPTLYFFNPNIHPCQEFKRRLNAARQFAEDSELPLVENARYGLRDFLDKIYPLVNEQDSLRRDGYHKRCQICYQWRLWQTAQFAAENNFDCFTTSLLYSKHQNHQLIVDLAQQAAQSFGVRFFYHDFRAGWQRGIDLSLQLDLYRQNYCGCIFSEEERFSNQIRKLRKKEAHHG